MSCIHFKFSNTVEDEKLMFEGLQISLSDLRDGIIKLKNLKANLCTLRIINAQTKEGIILYKFCCLVCGISVLLSFLAEYKDDSQMLPRNSSVVVSRIPVSSTLKAPKSK